MTAAATATELNKAVAQTIKAAGFDQTGETAITAEGGLLSERGRQRRPVGMPGSTNILRIASVER